MSRSTTRQKRRGAGSRTRSSTSRPRTRSGTMRMSTRPAVAELKQTSTDINHPDYAPIRQLMDVVDEYSPQPERDVTKPFLMPIEDVFSIKGRGTVVTGRAERGTLKKGEEIEIIGLQEESIKTTVTGIEAFHKELDAVLAGDNAGILLRGTQREEVQRGMVLAKPGSIKPHKKSQDH